MQLTANLLLLMLSLGKGCCFLDSWNLIVTRDEQHIESPGYPHHTWRSERKVLTFTAKDDNSQMVFYITGDFGQTDNCSRNTAGLKFKEVTGRVEYVKILCGSGNFTYEGHGAGAVTAVIAPGVEEIFRITYTLKSLRCQETLFAYPHQSVISSPDAAWNMTRCQWNIVAGYGYVVQIHVLMSNLSTPCYDHRVDVDLGNGSTQSWCGQQTSSFTSRNSRMSIRFNMSSVADGHAFTLVYKRIPDPNRFQTQIWTTATPKVTRQPWITKKQWSLTTSKKRAENTWTTAIPNVTNRPWTTKKSWARTTWNPWLLHRPVTTHYWTSQRPTESGHYRTTQSPLRADNQSDLTCVDGDVQTIRPSFQDQVLLLTTPDRTKSGWRVMTEVLPDSDHTIELKIIFPMDVQTSYEVCHDRYLEVYDGPSCNSPFLGKWCGQSNQTLVTTGQDVLLVYADGRRFNSLPWTVHYRLTDSDVVPPAVAFQTAASSSKAGAIVGSVFGVVLLVLAVVGALGAWRISSRKKSMSLYQNQDIIDQSVASSSISMVTPASFSNAFYEEVKSPENGKETTVAPGNMYDTPKTSEKPQFPLL